MTARRRRAISDSEPGTRDAESKGSASGSLRSKRRRWIAPRRGSPWSP